MDSRTKHRLQREQVEALVRAALGAASRVKAVEELTEGMFNVSYALELEGQRPIVLKVAPAPGTPLLTYEQEIMRTEVDFYERASRLEGIPVPKVLARDFSRSIVPSDCFFMEKLRGQSLERARKRLSRKELEQVRFEVGAIVARLGALRGEVFGYPRLAASTQAPTWREAFLKMVGLVLADAERYAVSLPRPASELRALFQAHAGALEEVKQPVLTHFDLWDGNVFIHRVEGVPHVEAIIDGERAFWGDPSAEFTSTALFRDIEGEGAFLQGYQSVTGTPVSFTEALRTRLSLYRAYLYLIMVTEGAPRGYTGLVHTALRQYFLFKLKAELKWLTARSLST